MSVLRMGVQRADITVVFVHVVKSNIDTIETALAVVGGEGDHLVISFSEVMMWWVFIPFKCNDKNIAYSKYADVCVSFLKEFSVVVS